MIITSSAIIPTGVEHTSAAHLVIDHWYDESPITVVWSTAPVACTDWVLGDVSSQGPVHQPADRVPSIVSNTIGAFPSWAAITEVQCGRCGAMVGPWALVRDGHLEGDELTDVAREVAELADQERESQRRKLIASLTDDAEDVASRLADGSLALDEVPYVGAMDRPGVGRDGDEVIAWGFLPSLAGDGDDEIVEVVRPIPAGCR